MDTGRWVVLRPGRGLVVGGLVVDGEPGERIWICASPGGSWSPSRASMHDWGTLVASDVQWAHRAVRDTCASSGELTMRMSSMCRPLGLCLFVIRRSECWMLRARASAPSAAIQISGGDAHLAIYHASRIRHRAADPGGHVVGAGGRLVYEPARASQRKTSASSTRFLDPARRSIGLTFANRVPRVLRRCWTIEARCGRCRSRTASRRSSRWRCLRRNPS